MAQIKILMADNDPDFLETRREFLEKEGYEVVTAFSPLEAQERLQQEDIALAVIDIRLLNDDDEKDVSGLDLAKNIGRSLPVLILTGYPAFDYARQALRLHVINGGPVARDFIAKKEGPEALLTAIRRVLEPAEKRKEVFASAGLAAEAKSRPSLSVGRWKSVTGSISILLALGAGIVATVYGDPRWLIGTVTLAVIAVVFFLIAE